MVGEHGLSVESLDGRLIVRGELDLATADRLLAAVATAGTYTLDLGEVSFVDSAGLRTLLRIRGTHPSTRLVGASPQLRRLAEIAGVTAHLFGDETPPA